MMLRMVMKMVVMKMMTLFKLKKLILIFKNFMLIYIHFSFNFLGLDNVDFENYFANELINMGRFLKPFK